MSKTAPVSDTKPAAQSTPAKDGGWLKGVLVVGGLAGGYIYGQWQAFTAWASEWAHWLGGFWPG